MTTDDFRTARARLSPEDFAVPGAPSAPPRDLVTEVTWKSLTSLPDDVSLRTTDSFGTSLKLVWDLWGEWHCLVGALQAAVPNPPESPIAHTACDAGDYSQSAVYNALTGHYRLAYTSLRGAVENMTIGLEFEVSSGLQQFQDWLAGDERGFGSAADIVSKHQHIATLEGDLMTAVRDNLFRQRRLQVDQGGLARRIFRKLSKYAHGAPGHTDGDIWQSNGPLFVPEAFENWCGTFCSVYALAVLESRLAQPSLDTLVWNASYNARALFEHAVGAIPIGTQERRLLESVPPRVW